MKKVVFISAMLLIVMGAGCSNIYEGLRMQQEMECQKLPGAERDECAGRSGMSYDEYQRQLKERQKDK
ncbi:MAG: hypothetical protein A2X56_10885 [Nitrospirae bacterium GWC2_57_13]|jgi:hypothetical protein|nr:MAG: hypothetical protein A2072_00745 [Nitrospirae bacterium GWC1_57_7]OGW30034.1 MAG: hypothetical protein A2X56_10885 [Nitrospirae bacterium GWC2_57_13]OGW41927.1 MAG: hypothetical protein A2X57_09830 [Nitrospirae bacterium GWD2_57_8]HAS54996.1 hypothetical protein [Nitrospiraceae bacterium]